MLYSINILHTSDKQMSKLLCAKASKIKKNIKKENKQQVTAGGNRA